MATKAPGSTRTTVIHFVGLVLLAVTTLLTVPSIEPASDQSMVTGSSATGP